MRDKKIADQIEEVKKLIQNDPDKAVEIINTLKGHPGLEFQDYYELAVIAGDAGYYSDQYDRAIEFYRAALEIPAEDKDLAKCYSRIAACYSDQDEFDKAEENYRKAISCFDTAEEEETIWETYHGLASAYMNTDKFKEAAGSYLKLAELCEPRETELQKDLYEIAIESLQTCHWKLGNDAKADEYFEKAQKIHNVSNSTLAGVSATKAHRLYEKKQWAEALKHYKEAIRLTDSEENKEDWKEYASMCEEEMKK